MKIEKEIKISSAKCCFNKQAHIKLLLNSYYDYLANKSYFSSTFYRDLISRQIIVYWPKEIKIPTN